METKKASPLMSLRKFFNDPVRGCPLGIKEVKEFKTEDPQGCSELANLCAEYYEAGGE